MKLATTWRYPTSRVPGVYLLSQFSKSTFYDINISQKCNVQDQCSKHILLTFVSQYEPVLKYIGTLLPMHCKCYLWDIIWLTWIATNESDLPAARATKSDFGSTPPLTCISNCLVVSAACTLGLHHHLNKPASHGSNRGSRVNLRVVDIVKWNEWDLWLVIPRFATKTSLTCRWLWRSWRWCRSWVQWRLQTKWGTSWWRGSWLLTYTWTRWWVLGILRRVARNRWL